MFEIMNNEKLSASVESVEAAPEILTGEAATAWIKHARTKVPQIVGKVDSDLIAAMQSLPATKVAAMKGRITKAVNARREVELKDGPLSKDFRHVESWNRSDAVARMFCVLEIDPHAYLMLCTMSDSEIEKHGFHPDAVTRNLKAYKKVVEVAEYIANGPELPDGTGSHLEAVFKTFVACSIIATRSQKVIPRDVCEDFLRSAELTKVSEDLRDAIDAFQAKHMSGGASTQTSQMVLTLANLKCGSVVRDGRTKHFALSHDSLVIRALAARFGMLDSLKQSA
jgi:hypothetical protein